MSKAKATWSNNWMSGIANGTSVTGISIPGTHESCARHGGAQTECQWFSIIQQLNRGIRFLDIRCRYEADSNSGRTQGIYFPIHHASEFQKIFFEEVQSQCVDFLNNNPTEFILMNVQMEYEGDGDAFRRKFLELIAPYQARHWYLKNTIPTLDSSLRGRIVLVRAHDSSNGKGWAKGPDSEWPDGASGGGLAWNGFNTNGDSSNATFETQNAWSSISGTDKGAKVEEYIKAANGNAANGRITLNFASYSSIRGPGLNAEDMNHRLQGFLQGTAPNGKWGALGVIPIDFVGNTGDSGASLENLIIEHQPHQVDATYCGVASWLAKASA